MSALELSATPKNGGFTLVELVVTLIVVGIMAYTALPRFEGLGAFDGAGAADQLRSILRYAQKTAVAQRRNVSVSYAGNAASICSYTGTTMPCSADCTGKIPIAPPGGRFQPAKSAPYSSDFLCFDAVGRPYDSTGLLSPSRTIDVSESGAVRIEQETGYVR